VLIQMLWRGCKAPADAGRRAPQTRPLLDYVAELLAAAVVPTTSASGPACHVGSDRIRTHSNCAQASGTPTQRRCRPLYCVFRLVIARMLDRSTCVTDRAFSPTTSVPCHAVEVSDIVIAETE